MICVLYVLVLTDFLRALEFVLSSNNIYFSLQLVQLPIHDSGVVDVARLPVISYIKKWNAVDRTISRRNVYISGTVCRKSELSLAVLRKVVSFIFS